MPERAQGSGTAPTPFYTDTEANAIGDDDALDVALSGEGEFHIVLVDRKFPVSTSILAAQKKTKDNIRRLRFTVGNWSATIEGGFAHGLLHQTQFKAQGISSKVTTPAPYYLFEMK